jgi:hypothetical protein
MSDHGREKEGMACSRGQGPPGWRLRVCTSSRGAGAKACGAGLHRLLRGVFGGPRCGCLPGAWEEREHAPRRSAGHHPLLGGTLARALAQLGLSLPNGVLQRLQQELQDDGETGGLPLSNILERHLTPIEVVNHRVHGHTALLRAGGLAPWPG